MLLTITNQNPPATDLGYLIKQRRVNRWEFPVGRSNRPYPMSVPMPGFRDQLGNRALLGMRKLQNTQGLLYSWFESMPGSQQIAILHLQETPLSPSNFGCHLIENTRAATGVPLRSTAVSRWRLM